MTIDATDTIRWTYAGAGTTGPFAVPVRFLEAAHLVVTRIDGAGVRTQLTLGSDYTVTGAGQAAGGNVTTATAVASGTSIEIERRVPVAQPVALAEGGPLPAETIEALFDRLVMIIQQEIDQRLRTPSLPPGAVVDLPFLFPSPEASKWISWDATGHRLVNRDTPTITGGGGVTDHGLLSGLTDDDHPQYANQARLAAMLGAVSWTAFGDVSNTKTGNALLRYDGAGGNVIPDADLIRRYGVAGITRVSAATTLGATSGDTVLIGPADPDAADLDDDFTVTLATAGIINGRQKMIRRIWPGDGVVTLAGLGGGLTIGMDNGDAAVLEYQANEGGWTLIRHFSAGGGNVVDISGKLDAAGGTLSRGRLVGPIFTLGEWDYDLATETLTLDHATGSFFRVLLREVTGRIAHIREINKPAPIGGQVWMYLEFVQPGTAGEGALRDVIIESSFMRFPTGAAAFAMPMTFGHKAALDCMLDFAGVIWDCPNGAVYFGAGTTTTPITAGQLAVSMTVGTTQTFSVDALCSGGVAPYNATVASVPGATITIVAGDIRIVANGTAEVTSGSYTVQDASGRTATGTISLTKTATTSTFTAPDISRGNVAGNQDPVYANSTTKWNLAVTAGATGGVAPYALTAFTGGAGGGTASIVGGEAQFASNGTPGTYTLTYTLQDSATPTPNSVTKTLTLIVSSQPVVTGNNLRPFRNLHFGSPLPTAKYGDRQLPSDYTFPAPRAGRIVALKTMLRWADASSTSTSDYSHGNPADARVRVTLKRASTGEVLAVSNIIKATSQTTSGSGWYRWELPTTEDVEADELLIAEWRNVTATGAANDANNRMGQNGVFSGTWHAGAPNVPWVTVSNTRWRRRRATVTQPGGGTATADSPDTENWRPTFALEYSDGQKRGQPYIYWENAPQKHENFLLLNSGARGRVQWTQDFDQSFKAMWCSGWTFGSGSAPAGNILYRFYEVSSAGVETQFPIVLTVPLADFPRYTTQFGPWSGSPMTQQLTPRFDWLYRTLSQRLGVVAGRRYRYMVTSSIGTSNFMWCAHPNYRDNYSNDGNDGILESWPPGTNAQMDKAGNGSWENFKMAVAGNNLTPVAKMQSFDGFDPRP